MLRHLREHPSAPRYTYPGGERLTAEKLEQVRDYARRLRTERRGWRPGEVPAWVGEFVARCRREVPAYRQRLDWSEELREIPSIRRSDLAAGPWAFVPDGLPIDELIVYSTSGTTAGRLVYPSHPVVPVRYLPLYEVALTAHGVRIEGGPGRVSIVQVSAQLAAFTSATVMSYFGEAGFARINLHGDNWRDPADAVTFLDDVRAEVYTGDPFAFAELANLPTRHRPKALLSGATTLLPGLRAELAERFGCPVLDVYSLNESGPVAFSAAAGLEILPHDLFVEILDEADRPCRPGVRGEVTLTGGVNPYLPLVRYRTGDHAALDFDGPLPRLVGLEGRAPVVFAHADGKRINSIDVTATLGGLALPFFALHQASDGALTFRTRADDSILTKAKEALRGLFGEVALTVERVPAEVAWSGKLVQYTRDGLSGG
jgi:phenylacetate-CoA ligase